MVAFAGRLIVRPWRLVTRLRAGFPPLLLVTWTWGGAPVILREQRHGGHRQHHGGGDPFFDLCSCSHCCFPEIIRRFQFLTDLQSRPIAPASRRAGWNRRRNPSLKLQAHHGSCPAPANLLPQYPEWRRLDQDSER